MSVRLSALSACFEGVIPSIIATAAADGMPNISYLSHVVRVDEGHVALSNQFFAKTAANIRANTQATLVLVDGLTGEQYLLDIVFVRSVGSGPLFERIALQLEASSAQVGMSEVMRLRSADIFRVERVAKVPNPVAAAPGQERAAVGVVALAEALRAIDTAAEADGIIDALLGGVRNVLGYGHALVMMRERADGTMVTTGSLGYAPSGLGSESDGAGGLIGAAAASGLVVKVNDMSRVRRFGQAIGMEGEVAEEATRRVRFPQMAEAMSQIAVPLVARGVVTGVLFVESAARLAFREEDEAALEILARQAAVALRAVEEAAADVPPEDAMARRAAAVGRDVRVVHHAVDDSVFVDGIYVVKGVAGAMLRLMVQWHLEQGRDSFSNREMRLALGSRMPEVKDNLETRLLLLRRRLEEKGSAVRVVRIGRGRVRLEAEGSLVLG